ncbi:MAG: glutamate dehydrogenase, partial [Alphaproteobacteria bacterium]|nr:glutamate dehydrogenase [Alphaproteobacteria bacterium]
MADQGAGSEDDGVAPLLVATAAALLDARKSGVPKDFVTGLFARAAPEDLLRYDARDVAAVAAAAWALFAERKPGAPKIRFEPPAAAASSERLKHVSTLEIVNDDMPFLVDSVLGELTECGVDIRLVVHPVFTVERDADGRLTAFHGFAPPSGAAIRESFIHIHVERIEDAARRGEIVQAVAQALADVGVSVHDWRPMLARVQEVIAGLTSHPPPLPRDEIAEAVGFLEWLVAGNFTFLGVRNYVFTADEDALEPQYESGLGLLRAREMKVLRRGNQLVTVTPEIREFLKQPQILIVTKSAVRSRVHRHAHMDYIGVKRFDATGKLAGEFRIIGLFTSTAYTKSTVTIPYLHRKVAAVVKRAGFAPEGHSGKALVNVLETYPRDELFQVDADTLYQFAMAILQLEERPRVRVLPRRDRFERFVSILVFIPRDRYDSDVRKAIGDYLARVYHGRVSAFFPFFAEGPLVRVHFIIGRYDGETPNPDRGTLEDAISGIVRTWTDGLLDALAAAYEPGRTHLLFERYRDAFSQGYREAYSPRDAVDDIRVIEGLSAKRPLSADFHRRATDEGEGIGLKIWSRGRPIPLSERVPVLENMGFRVVDELTYRVAVGPPDEPHVWFHDMVIEPTGGLAIDLAARKAALEACFLVVMTGGAENDGYNALVLAGGLMWRDVALLRAISRFLRQIRVPYSQDYMWATLTRHAAIAAQIVELFHARFDPRAAVPADERKAREAAIAAAIEAALQAVESLDEDRILRHFVNAVQSALRTSFYQLDADGRPKGLIAIKFASRKLDGLPLPKPLYEISVYSPRVEGVHLRFGKVARGGIRWSDRPQDFRTEVLGLVKAQQVKNAVIVPVGAKGGFVPKFLPKGPREAVQAEG